MIRLRLGGEIAEVEGGSVTSTNPLLRESLLLAIDMVAKQALDGVSAYDPNPHLTAAQVVAKQTGAVIVYYDEPESVPGRIY